MINIMCAGNYRMFDGMLILSLSILKHTTEPVHFYILTMDLREKDPSYKPVNQEHAALLQKLYQDVHPESRVTIIDTIELYKEKLENSVNRKTCYTPYSMLRLLTEYIAALPDKILYLDTDVIANSDISELFNINIDDYEVAGVKDAYGEIWIRRDYMNSGVLLINKKRIAETGLFSRAIELCQKRRMLMPDQSAINFLVKDRLILPDEYNEQSGYREGTKLQHFAKRVRWLPVFHFSNIKPWQVDLVKNKLKITAYNDILEDYLVKIRQYEAEGGMLVQNHEEPLDKTEPIEQSISQDQVLETQVEKQKKKNVFGAVFSFVIFALLMSVLWELCSSLMGGEVATFRDMLNHMRAGYLGISVALLILMIFAEACKFGFIGKLLGCEKDFARDVKVALLGKYYDNITPFSSGGQPMQIYYLTKKGNAVGKSTSIIVTKFLTQMVAWILVGASVMLLLAGKLDVVENQTTRTMLRVCAWIGLSINTLGPMTILFISVLPKAAIGFTSFFLKLGKKFRLVKNYDAAFEKLKKTVDDFVAGTRFILANPLAFIKLVMLNLVEPVCSLSLPFFIVLALGGSGVEASVPLLLTVVALTMYATYSVVFIPTPGNSGAVETMFLLAFSGITSSVLFWIVLTWRFFTYYVYVLIGAGMSFYSYIIKSKRTKKQSELMGQF